MFLSHIKEISTKFKFQTMFFNGAQKQYDHSPHISRTKSSLENILLLGYRDGLTAYFFHRGLEFSSQHIERSLSLAPEEPEPSSVEACAPAPTQTHIHVHTPIYIQTYAHTPAKIYIHNPIHNHAHTYTYAHNIFKLKEKVK